MRKISNTITALNFRPPLPSIKNIFKDINDLSAIHRPQPSDSFHQAVEWVVESAEKAGLEEVKIHSYPADGHTMLGTYKALPAWDAKFGTLTLLNSSSEILADFPTIPVSLASYSRSIDICTDIVNVNSGIPPDDYKDKNVQGKIVLAGGTLPQVQLEAVFRRGAVGIISYDYIGPMSEGFAQRPDLIGWGQNHMHKGPDGEKSTFAFMISRNQAKQLIRCMQSGENLKARVIINGSVHKGKYEIVSGIIKGSSDEEFVLSAHLDHVAPSANDNASGVAVLLETARIIGELKKKELWKGERSLHFIFGPEVVGPLSYLARKIPQSNNIVGALVLDMVGADPKQTGACLNGYPPPYSCPAPWGILLEEGMHRYLTGDSNNYASAYSAGGDDYVFSDSSFGIPAVRLTDWPYPFIHTDQDTLDKLSPEKLRDVTKLIVWLASASVSRDQQIGRHLIKKITQDTVVKAQGLLNSSLSCLATAEKREKHNQLHQLLSFSSALLSRTSSLYNGLEEEVERSMKVLNESIDQERYSQTPASAGLSSQDRFGASTILRRNSDILGPMHPFFFDFPSGIHGRSHYRQTLPLFKDFPSVISYEALNFVNGKRSIQDIGDLVSGLYHPIPTNHLIDYFLILEKAGVVESLSAE